MSRRVTAPIAVTVATAQNEPAVAVAASIALALMRKAKARCWADVTIPEHVRLSPAQRDALCQSAVMLTYLRGRTMVGQPAVTILVCPVCRRWTLTGSASGTPANCPATLGCSGKPFRVGEAKFVEATADDLA